MKLYLDNSFLNRPFDDPLAGMNGKEGAVLFDIIRLAREGTVELVRSAMIEVENAANEIAARKSFVDSVMHLAAGYQHLTDNIVSRAQTIVQEDRLQPLDAVQLASAEVAQVISLLPATILCSNAIKERCALLPRLSFSNIMKTITKQNT